MVDGSKRRRIYLLLLLLITSSLAACGGNGQAEPTSTSEAAPTVVSGTESELPTPVILSTDEGEPTPSFTKVPPTDTPGNSEFQGETRNFFSTPEYGVQTFLWWRPDIAQRDLELARGLDFNWVKQTFPWRDIESIEKGKYDWWHPDQIVEAVENAGMKLLVRIDRQPYWSQGPNADLKDSAPPADYNDFGDFCGVLASRYKGRIGAYQVWNEPNLSREWGDQPPDPAAYTELLKVCYEAIKVADPQAIIVSAGLAPTGTGLPVAMPDSEFLQGMYDAGAADYFDVLGLNAPGYKAPPETSPEEAENNPDFGGGRWFAFRHVEDMRRIMVANGDEGKQAAVLELGWTTDAIHPEYAWHAVTEQEQAEYLVRAYQYASENWQPWMGLMVTIYIADPDWTAESNEQWWWAITLPDGSTRPAYLALRDMPK